jgi:hypothetical protein
MAVSKKTNRNKSKKRDLFKNAEKKAKEFYNILRKENKGMKKKFVKEYLKKYGKGKTDKAFSAGQLLTFRYDAKHKQFKFDKNPLVISLGNSKKYGKNYFLGLNIHWLPQKQRVLVASLIVEMLDMNNGVLTYDDIKPVMQIFKNSPVLRMYIKKNVSNKIILLEKDVYLRAASIDYATWHNP